ncbi:MAG: D-cysteine desulfhydrase family protein [Candidatus Egerieousia sp.]
MDRLKFANLPTRIDKLERLSKELDANIYIKRDDQTGSEWSGNKIRKLEFLAADAQAKGCNLLITCGGIQSNHARATVTVATYLGMKSAVLLRVSENPPARGNYFLDKLLGADVRFCTRAEYSDHRMEIMQEMADSYTKQGYKPYIIPEGASTGIGNFGYMNCLEEIVAQEKEMGVKFDTIVVATGSGGTYAGLWLQNALKKYGKRIIGMAVCDDNDYFKNVVKNIAGDTLKLIGADPSKVDFDTIEFNDKYVGIGYALSRPEELEFIKKVARTEAVVLDPVYTGKAMYGVWNELQPGGNLKHDGNILFIHTGGLYGLFPISDTFPLE